MSKWFQYLNEYEPHIFSRKIVCNLFYGNDQASIEKIFLSELISWNKVSNISWGAGLTQFLNLHCQTLSSVSTITRLNCFIAENVGYSTKWIHFNRFFFEEILLKTIIISLLRWNLKIFNFFLITVVPKMTDSSYTLIAWHGSILLFSVFFEIPPVGSGYKL